MISRFKSMDVEPHSDTHMTDWRCHEPRNHIEILGIGDFVQPVRAAHEFYFDALRLNRCQVVNQIITRLFECVRYGAKPEGLRGLDAEQGLAGDGLQGVVRLSFQRILDGQGRCCSGMCVQGVQ